MACSKVINHLVLTINAILDFSLSEELLIYCFTFFLYFVDSACFDDDAKYCQKWAPKGYCAKSSKVMSGKCKLSCKMCLAGENIYICVSVAAPESLKLILNRSFLCPSNKHKVNYNVYTLQIPNNNNKPIRLTQCCTQFKPNWVQQ